MYKQRVMNETEAQSVLSALKRAKEKAINIKNSENINGDDVDDVGSIIITLNILIKMFEE